MATAPAALSSNRRSITVVEQQLPLHLLNIEAQIQVLRTAAHNRLGHVDKGERIPHAFGRQLLPRPRIAADRRQLAGPLAQILKHRKPANMPEPILGVRIIALAPMQDAVPETA